jgi:hypothetical protein
MDLLKTVGPQDQRNSTVPSKKLKLPLKNLHPRKMEAARWSRSESNLKLKMKLKMQLSESNLLSN